MTYKIIPAGHANIDYEQNKKKNEENFWIFILYLESIQIDRKHFFWSNIEITLRCKIAKVEKIKIYPVEKCL